LVVFLTLWEVLCDQQLLVGKEKSRDIPEQDFFRKRRDVPEEHLFFGTDQLFRITAVISE
jgi:hypothetical protein